MRLVFMGTPAFAVPTLNELVGQGHEVAAVYTRAAAAAGRGMTVRPSPVQAAAERFGLTVRQPSTLRGEDEVAALMALGPDAVVVVAYGMLLPPAILAIPPLGCLNLHGSLLPRWRGAAPIQRAVMAGDRESGVMVMRMEAGLDTGPVAMAERVPIGPGTTAGDLHDALAPIGADLMGRAVAALGRGTLQFRAQAVEGVTVAAKIGKHECRLDWGAPAVEVDRTIRGLSPFPGAFFETAFGTGPVERVKVLRSRVASGNAAPGTVLDEGGTLTVACGSGAVELTQLQRAGKAPLDAAAFRRGVELSRGTLLPSR